MPPSARAGSTFALEQGIPITAFESDDVQADYEQLEAKGVAFTRGPTTVGTTTIAVFADTCGNLIQIYENE